MARDYTYDFDFDNLTLFNGSEDIVLAAKGTITYTMTPYYPGSYDRGMPPEYPEPEISDVQYESLSLFLEGGKELPMIVDGVSVLDQHDGLPLSKIQAIIEDSDDFLNLAEYMVENALEDNYDD